MVFRIRPDFGDGVGGNRKAPVESRKILSPRNYNFPIVQRSIWIYLWAAKLLCLAFTWNEISWSELIWKIKWSSTCGELETGGRGEKELFWTWLKYFFTTFLFYINKYINKILTWLVMVVMLMIMDATKKHGKMWDFFDGGEGGGTVGQDVVKLSFQNALKAQPNTTFCLWIVF